MATLSDVRRFLRDHHRASLAEIALGVGSAPDATRALLDIWLEKQRVRRIVAPCAGSCGQSCCSETTMTETYEWIEPPPMH